MNKELTPLEALEDIILYLNASEPDGLYCKNIEVIKNALKALEIILNKGIDRLMIEIYEDYIDYNNNHNSRACDLTQEEFDLLKEILK